MGWRRGFAHSRWLVAAMVAAALLAWLASAARCPRADRAGLIRPAPAASSADASQTGSPPSLAGAEAWLRGWRPLPRRPTAELLCEQPGFAPMAQLERAAGEFEAVIAREGPSVKALRGLA